MASQRRALLLDALLSCACLGLALKIAPTAEASTRRQQLDTPAITEPLAPYGWWQSLALIKGSQTVNCGLRDFPPIPWGQGPTRILCGGETAAFDAYWTWKLADPTDPNATDIAVKTGQQVHLRIFNPVVTYCMGSSPVKCGVGFESASLFSVEKVGNPATGLPVDFTVDSLYIKANGRYCRINGKNSASMMYCDQAAASGASVFKMPYSHFYSVSLTSMLNSKACGGNFLPLKGSYSDVNCTDDAWIPSNYYTNYVLSAQAPGAKALGSGVPYAITANHAPMFNYQVATWQATSTGVRFVMVGNNGAGWITVARGSWFVLEKKGAAPGTPLANGDVVAIKSVNLGKYCGLASTSAQVKCDLASYPSSAGYTFRITLA